MTGAPPFAARITVQFCCQTQKSAVLMPFSGLMGAHSLKPIFYGLAYTPFNALEPWCGANLNNVTEDILLMSQMTSTRSHLPKLTTTVSNAVRLILVFFACSSLAHVRLGLQPDATGPSSYSRHEGNFRLRQVPRLNYFPHRRNACPGQYDGLARRLCRRQLDRQR